MRAKERLSTHKIARLLFTSTFTTLAISVAGISLMDSIVVSSDEYIAILTLFISYRDDRRFINLRYFQHILFQTFTDCERNYHEQ